MTEGDENREPTAQEADRPSADPRTFRLTVAYDGTAYAGWQRQPNGVAIQELLEDAVARVCGSPATVIGSGRTDAGVHAKGQVCSFRVATSLSAESLARAIQANVPHDVVVVDASETRADFHAQRSAIGKRYRYCLDDGPTPNPFLARYAWRVRRPLDAGAMNLAAARLVGTHDFKSFESAGAERKTTIRTVAHAYVAREPGPWGEALWFDVAANGFLYRMVRNLVGMLHEIGRGAREPAWADEVLAARTRSLRFPAAPPQGLFLWSVDYPDVHPEAQKVGEAAVNASSTRAGQGRAARDSHDAPPVADDAEDPR